MTLKTLSEPTVKFPKIIPAPVAKKVNTFNLQISRPEVKTGSHLDTVSAIASAWNGVTAGTPAALPGAVAQIGVGVCEIALAAGNMIGGGFAAASGSGAGTMGPVGRRLMGGVVDIFLGATAFVPGTNALHFAAAGKDGFDIVVSKMTKSDR
jgi:hypothetical protein